MDNISPALLKLAAPAISGGLCGYFNASLMMAESPSEWKAAKVIPIPKHPKAN